MFCPNNSGLSEQGVTNPGLNVLDLLNGLLLCEPIQEQIDIGGRTKPLVVELAKAAFRATVLVRHRKQSVDHGRSCSNHVAPERKD